MSDASVKAVETHISRLFFTPDRVLKQLKPISTGFLDHRDRSTRLGAIDDELRLNRRFAPDIYLGVADVVEQSELVDRLLVMRRLPDDRRLATLLDDADADEHLRSVARIVAAAHASAEPIMDPRPLATAEGLASFWRSSFEEMSPRIGDVIDGAEFDEVRRLAMSYLDHRAALFERRQQDGHVRDGHGDLVAADIFILDDGPRILDCLAFDADYRICDVIGDIGFLVMDVERIAGADLAATLLDHYCELTGERHPPTLIEHWIAYRAHVRTKVALLRHDQGAPDAATEAMAYHRMTVEHLRWGRSRMLLIGGGPGTGKSTLAAAIAEHTGWAILDSDTIRKDLHGVDHGDHAVDEHPDLYGESATASTYDEIVRRAGVLVDDGVTAILDATWQRHDDRELARATARRLGAELIEIECRLDPDAAKDRIRARTSAGPSDATPELVDRWRQHQDPWHEAWKADTTTSADELAHRLLAATGVSSS